jgi:hypothetical protein
MAPESFAGVSVQPVYGVSASVVQSGTVQPVYGVSTSVHSAAVQPSYGVSTSVHTAAHTGQ